MLMTEMRPGFVRVDSRLDSIDSRMHNTEARAKNEDASQRQVDFVPLVKADGTAIANFPRNSAAVESLSSMSTNILHPCPL
ncbi:hypothetical protein NW768_011832 [Fusarium equiseti]|uniref:Uncharacterized protein n=1 Tax=Fusarium equiseti TaxID=61235 RepID=A0ABQ8QWU8_FUSEQ|nr:hypothetical protein NW768_011832 [Fusarium equiseti]